MSYEWDGIPVTLGTKDDEKVRQPWSMSRKQLAALVSLIKGLSQPTVIPRNPKDYNYNWKRRK